MHSKSTKNLKITIITVCYNSEKTIEKTLESVANQKISNIEHLIIDGKSTDQTLLLVKKYPHIKKIISENDDGIYEAMNKGIEIASGDIIGFLNSDDFYVKNNILSTILNIFDQNPNIDGCYSDLIYTDQFDTSKNIRYWKSSKFKPGLF
jgi:glycosyltransferase involved in cell wall biosynthesis